MLAFIAGLSLVASVASAEPPSTMPLSPPRIAVEERLDTETIKGLAGWYARQYEVDEELVKSIIQCESSWNPEARNPNSSAKGLMQIIDGTWEHFDCSGDVLNAYDNLACGMKILSTSGKHHWEQCL